MIVMPPMPPEQTASWLGVLDLYDHLGQDCERARPRPEVPVSN